MKKLFTLLLTVAILTAAGLAGGAFLMGIKTEARYQEFMLDIPESPFIKISTPVYKRRLFTSTAVSNLELSLPKGMNKAQPETPISFRLSMSHTIWHGPIPLQKLPTGSYQLKPILAFIETNTSIPTDVLPKDPELLDIIKKLTLTSHTFINLDGTSDSTYSMPAWQKTAKSGFSVNWKGLTGNTSLSADLKGAKGKTVIPGLDLVAQSGELHLGTTNMTMNTRPGANGLGVGTANVSLDKIVFNDGRSEDEQHFQLSGLSISSDTKERGQLLDSFQKIKVNHVLINNLKHGPFLYELEFRNLDAPTLVQLQEKAQVIQQQMMISQGAPDPLLFADLSQLLPNLLKKSPAIDLKKLSINTRHGDFQGRALFSFDGSNSAAMSNPILMVTALKIEADADISEHLLAKLMKSMTLDQLRKRMAQSGQFLSERELDKQASRASRTQLQGLLQQGYIAHEKDRFKVKLRFQEGTLVINSLTIPFEDLLVMLAG